MDNTAIIPTQKRTPLTGLPASAFQHPLDRQATENLKKIKEGLDQSMTNRFYRFMANRASTHPFPGERARALDEWVTSPEYKNILSGNYQANGEMVKTISCPTCKQVTEQGVKFCKHCGTPLIVR